MGHALILVSGKSLRISASQSLLLIRILPFLIGDVVLQDDPNWKCFLLLSKIVDIVVCPWATADLCAILQVTIEEHHRRFVALYTDEAVIPKFHFLLHYPRQILCIGPLIHSWNMRNEAKLNIFKQASRLGNFKNIASSVAKRHQRLLCNHLSSCPILDSLLECGPCDQAISIDCMPHNIQNSLMSLIPNLNSETKVTHPTWVKCLGRTVKRNAFIVTGSDGFYPAFAKVVDILVLVDVVVLCVSHCNVLYYDDHYHAYAISPSIDESFLCFSELKVNTILHAHRKADVLYIYLKEYFHVF